jgi:hypothetical protein
MGISMSLQYYDATPSFQLLSDIISHKIILATIDIAKTAQQIALENELAASIRYNNS